MILWVAMALVLTTSLGKSLCLQNKRDSSVLMVSLISTEKGRGTLLPDFIDLDISFF